MVTKTFLKNIAAELEAPRRQRPFGSGWLSGTLGLLAGLVGLGMVIVLRYPAVTRMPELAAIDSSALYRAFLYFVLIWGFLLAALSLTLRRQKALGTAAMVVTLLATMIGSLPKYYDYQFGGIFFGLDFFILNVLFTGALFIPVERLLARNKEQIVFRDEWREDIFYYLVSSLMVQVLSFLTLAPSNFVASAHDISALRAFARDLPWIVQLFAIMLLTDLAQYWLHRAFHRVPALWRFHAVHHSAKSMDWIAGARMHFLEIIILRSLTATPMLVIGFQESAIQAYVLILYVYSTFIHAIEKEAIDVNFAIHFPFLDRLFGTHHLPDGEWPKGYGIEGHPVPQGYWKQLLYPFRRERSQA
jgi:sterol desaturase/sphingolipid hydroxylase (fatty acid hydroxylase superfamily)